MLELIIKSKENKKQIALVEDEILTEYYEEEENSSRNEGNIYIGTAKDILKGMQAAFINIGTERNGFIHLKDILPKIDEAKQENNIKEKIEDVIKLNERLLVQVKKDSNEKKGARISTHINLPSKYIVLMPNTEIITISQKIQDEKEQERLKEIVKENLTPGNGAIIRTSAIGKKEELIEDIKYIEEKWKKIVDKFEEQKEKGPSLLHKSEDIVEKILLDLTDKKVEKITVNDTEEYKKLQEIKKSNKEYLNIKIEVKNEESILDIYQLEKQIEKSKNRKIWLKCGGFITIDKTEALTAIDVNTGKYTGTNDVEETIFRVNKEATIEIAKQLRLRDIGGIIIIDYIDMHEENHKEEIQTLLQEELKKDRSKTQIEGFTNLDLMELTRKHICSHKE